ncbi:MAG: hypothetical protein Q9186_003506 [Xanthomendoza sp. 1 TL-2023]
MSAGSNLAPRRSSYASVAAGNTNAYNQSLIATSRPGAFSHLATPNPPSASYPQDRAGRVSLRNSGSDTQMDDNIDIPGSWGRGSMGNYSSQYGYGQYYGVAGVGDGDGFFVPSYLQNSKYVDRLQAAHEAKILAQREAPSTRAKGNGALSSRSSNASLPKLTQSHRGTKHEIIEHQPPEDDGGLTPLPSKWAETDKNQAIEVGLDGLEVRFISGAKLHDHEAAATRTDYPIPAQAGIYYYEVTVNSRGKDGMIGLGFSGPKVPLEKMPGWEPDSWGWHGDDGNTFCCNAFRDLKDVHVYPSVGMGRPNAQLTVNFGQKPFVFDIDDMIKREREAINESIASTSISNLHSQSDESSFLKELVAQFLAHDGFVETAKAFANETRAESRALEIDSDISHPDSSIEEDLDASNRQHIRAAIMDGDVDKAMKRTHAYYPQVLQDRSHVYFRLRCQKFVEMIGQTAELLEVPAAAKQPKPLNGHEASSMHLDVEQTEMEVDDQKNEVEDWDQMEMEEGDMSVKYKEMVDETLRYGQELKQEFQDDSSTDAAFKEIFSLFMYEDPRKSPQAHLLDRASRVPVAEELNSAILGELYIPRDVTYECSRF